MVIHRVDLKPYNNKGTTSMSYNGEHIGKTRKEPLCEAARNLLNTGMATEEETIETYRGLTKCLSAKVGVAARLTVRETDEGFLGFVERRASPYAEEAAKQALPAEPQSRQPLNVAA